MKTKFWNYNAFDLEADDGHIPDILYLKHFFNDLEDALKPIMAGMLEFEFDENYAADCYPTSEDVLKDPENYEIKKITFRGNSDRWWVYFYGDIIDAYAIARKRFMGIKKPTKENNLVWDDDAEAEFKRIKKFFENH